MYWSNQKEVKQIFMLKVQIIEGEYVDRKFKSFMLLSGLLVLLFIVIVFCFRYIYMYSTINTYNAAMQILMAMSAFFTILLISTVAAVYFTYRNNAVSPYFLWLARIGMSFFMPFIFFLVNMLRNNPDNIRNVYISVNNILAQANLRNVTHKDVLLLLPHCLQNSDCRHKITNNTGNCKRCGRCCIGDILNIADSMGIAVSVATGGTAAINEVRKYRPKLIFAVACERDLVAGISDVRGIPVIGILNQRINGPCYNTTVDTAILEQKLRSVLETGGSAADSEVVT